MCYFLTIAVPADCVDLIAKVFARGFQTHPTTNPSVAGAIPAGYAARLVTSGMCSCDLYSRPATGAASDSTAHLRRKYRKLGWSEAKIRRALEQVAAGKSKSIRPTSGLRADVTEGLGAICRAAGSVACLVHSYDGDVETERLPLRRTEPCECEELPARAQALEEDEVLIAAIR